MSLQEYRRKRRFDRTPEPDADVPRGRGKRPIWLSVDGGELIPVQSGDELRVKKSKNRAVMAHVSQKSFYDIAYEKLGEIN